MRNEYEQSQDFLETLYAGLLDASAWDDAMGKLAELMQALGPLCVSRDPSTGRVLREEGHGYEHHAAAMAEYRDYWGAKDPRVIASLAAPLGRAIVDEAIQPLRQFKRTEFYNEYLKRHGIPWGMGTWLHRSPHRQTFIAMHRGPDQRPFDDQDSARMQRLAPHLRRAYEIKDRLALASVQAEALKQGLGRASFGVLVLDTEGRIMECSEQAFTALRTAGVLERDTAGKVAFSEPASGRLRQLLGTFLRAGRLEDGAIHLSRDGGRLPLSLVLTPVRDLALTWFSSGPRWIMFVFDPESKLKVLAEKVRQDLGVSAREAEICALVAEGVTPKGIGNRLGISAHTVRTQLKAVFRKVGVHSQRELTQRILAGPSISSKY